MKGKDVFLVFKGDIGQALTPAASIDYDNEGYILGEAAKFIGRKFLGHQYEEFKGKFRGRPARRKAPER